MSNELPDIGLADLLKRTEEAGDCLEWTGYALKGRFPQWRIGGVFWVVRRLIWLLTRGPLKPGMQVNVKCRNELCVHPDHLVARTKAIAQRGIPIPEDRRVRIAMAKRKRSKLTIEQVREIRASDEQGKVLDERYGLTPGYASRIKLGQAWKDHANPFSGLERR